MKVFFDARMIGHPGIGRYIRCLLSEFKKVKDFELNLLGERKIIEGYPDINGNIVDFSYPIYSMQEQIGFLRLKKTLGSSILHIPHYNIPVLAKFNLVVTIHDLIHIVYPHGASKKFASIYMKVMIERALKRAEKVICVSNTTRKSLEEIYGLKNLNIDVIYEGVEKSFFPIKDKHYLLQIKEKYKLPDKFILYVGSIRRHKNIDMLLKVLSQLKNKMPDIYLVLVGRFSHALDLNQKNVLYLGEIPQDQELAAIYNLDACFCNFSFHEGFGLTILEAQKCGIPVVCSNIATHTETGGEGILAVNPTDVDQIEEVLYNVLTNNILRENLINKGLTNVERFSWSLAAEKTIEIYKDAKLH